MHKNIAGGVAARMMSAFQNTSSAMPFSRSLDAEAITHSTKIALLEKESKERVQVAQLGGAAPIGGGDGGSAPAVAGAIGAVPGAGAASAVAKPNLS